MTKLQGFTQPIFASNGGANDASVFGTMKTSPQYTSDVAASVDTAEFLGGWKSAVEVEYAPYIEDMNTLQRAVTYQLAYNQQEGIPEWMSTTTYYTGGVAKLVTDGKAQLYVSKIDNNTGNLLSDTSSWKLWLDSSVTYANDSNVLHPADITGAAKSIITNMLPPLTVMVTNSLGNVGYPETPILINELVTLSGVGGNIQEQLNGKQATITGAATSVATNNLSGDKVVVTNSSGKLAAATSISTTELGYLDGVTSNIQTQLNSTAKTFTPGNRTTLGVTLNSSYSMPDDGILMLTIQVGGQTNSTVTVHMVNSGQASASSATLCRVLHNGGGSERNNIPVIFPVRKNQAIYLDWNGTGFADVIYAFA